MYNDVAISFRVFDRVDSIPQIDPNIQYGKKNCIFTIESLKFIIITYSYKPETLLYLEHKITIDSQHKSKTHFTNKSRAHFITEFRIQVVVSTCIFAREKISWKYTCVRLSGRYASQQANRVEEYKSKLKQQCVNKKGASRAKGTHKRIFRVLYSDGSFLEKSDRQVRVCRKVGWKRRFRRM